MKPRHLALEVAFRLVTIAALGCLAMVLSRGASAADAPFTQPPVETLPMLSNRLSLCATSVTIPFFSNQGEIVACLQTDYIRLVPPKVLFLAVRGRPRLDIGNVTLHFYHSINHEDLSDLHATCLNYCSSHFSSAKSFKFLFHSDDDIVELDCQRIYKCGSGTWLLRHLRLSGGNNPGHLISATFSIGMDGIYIEGQSGKLLLSLPYHRAKSIR